MKSFVLGLVCSFLLLAVRPSWTMEEAPSSSPLQSSSGNLDLETEVDPDAILSGLELQGSPGKRAYTYVSEYKRLPIYNFGLGKRGWAGNNADDTKVRFDSRLRSLRTGTSCSPSGACNPFFQRARLYSFGLGKRARPYSFGLGKRAGGGGSSPASSSYVVRGDDYDDDLTREPATIQDYLEKRSRLYSFGLGKRLTSDERGGQDFGQRRFNFGLGKRYTGDDFGRRYKFGLGKRRLVVDDDENDNDNDENQQLENLIS